MQRIALRDRPYERQMERGLHRTNSTRLTTISSSKTSNHRSPVLVIDSNQLDFVRYPEDLRWIENRIRQALQLAPYQPELLPMELNSHPG